MYTKQTLKSVRVIAFISIMKRSKWPILGTIFLEQILLWDFSIAKSIIYCSIGAMIFISLYKKAFSDRAGPTKLLNAALIKLLLSVIFIVICTYCLTNASQGYAFITLYYIFLTLALSLIFLALILNPILALKNINNATDKWDVAYVWIFLVIEFIFIGIIWLISSFACWKANPPCSMFNTISYFYKIPQDLAPLYNS